MTRDLMTHILETAPSRSRGMARSAIATLFLDHIGVTAWGSDSPVATIMREHVLDDLSRSRTAAPTLPVIGTPTSCSATEAAMANAVASSCFEFDDTHTPGSAHPGSVIFPAAMAAAAISGCSQDIFLAAVYAGYEVMGRLARAVNPHAHRARHFHPTSTTGHFGAAAAAAVCFGLDLDRSVTALSLAGTVAGGSMQFLPEGAITKQLHPAYAVQRGVQAAQLAARGFPGLSDPIGGTRGFLAGQSEDPRPERLLADLDTAIPEIMQTGIKPYPSCRNTHSPASALFDLLNENRFVAADIDSITVGLIKPGLATVWEPSQRTRRPQTLADAQFSMPYVAAVSVLDRALGTAQFDVGRFSDPQVCALMDRVSCVSDPHLDERYPREWPSWVQITLNDGTTLRAEASHPKGDPANALTRDEVVAKFDDLTRHRYSPAARASIIATVDGLTGPDTLDTVFATFGGDALTVDKIDR